MAYPYEQKKAIVETVAKLVACGTSFASACKKVDTPRQTVEGWIKAAESAESAESKELKKIYDDALKEQVTFLNELAVENLTGLLKAHIEKTEYVQHYIIRDADGVPIRDKDGKMQTEKVMDREVIQYKVAKFEALQLQLKSTHPNYKDGGNGAGGNGDDEIMDWSEQGEDGTRIVK